MTGKGGWFSTKRGQWRRMSAGEKLSASLNLLVDAALSALLLVSVWVAATRDPWTYVFWVPFLLFVLYKRVGQAGRRWAVRPRR